MSSPHPPMASLSSSWVLSQAAGREVVPVAATTWIRGWGTGLAGAHATHTGMRLCGHVGPSTHGQQPPTRSRTPTVLHSHPNHPQMAQGRRTAHGELHSGTPRRAPRCSAEAPSCPSARLTRVLPLSFSLLTRTHTDTPPSPSPLLFRCNPLVQLAGTSGGPQPNPAPGRAAALLAPCDRRLDLPAPARPSRRRELAGSADSERRAADGGCRRGWLRRLDWPGGAGPLGTFPLPVTSRQLRSARRPCGRTEGEPGGGSCWPVAVGTAHGRGEGGPACGGVKGQATSAGFSKAGGSDTRCLSSGFTESVLFHLTNDRQLEWLPG